MKRGPKARSGTPASDDRPDATLYDLLVVTEDGEQVLVRVATREPTTDADLADEVLGSVRVQEDLSANLPIPSRMMGRKAARS